MSKQKKQANKRSRKVLNETVKSTNLLPSVLNEQPFADDIIEIIYSYMYTDTRILSHLSRVCSAFRKIYMNKYSKSLVLFYVKERSGKQFIKLRKFTGLLHVNIHISYGLQVSFDHIAELIENNIHLESIVIKDARHTPLKNVRANELLKAITGLGKVTEKPQKVRKTRKNEEVIHVSDLKTLALPRSVFQNKNFNLFKTAIKMNPGLETIRLEIPCLTNTQLKPLDESFAFMKSVTSLELDNFRFGEYGQGVIFNKESQFNFAGLKKLCLWHCDNAESFCQDLLPKTLNLEKLEIYQGHQYLANRLSLETIGKLSKLCSLVVSKTKIQWTTSALLLAVQKMPKLSFLCCDTNSLTLSEIMHLETICENQESFECAMCFPIDINNQLLDLMRKHKGFRMRQTLSLNMKDWKAKLATLQNSK